MKKMHRFRDFFAGVLAAVFLAALVLPAGASTLNKIIEVFTGVTIYIDGEKLMPTDAAGKPVDTFIYNGTTYIPLRSVSESLGESVKWDGSTRSVYIGDIPGETKYFLTECPPYKYNTYSVTLCTKQNTESFEMCGNKYSDGLYISGTYGAYFNLNGQYESITMDLGYPDFYDSSNSGGVAFFVDGELVAEYTVQPGDYVKQITVPLKYGLQLQIVGTARQACVGLGNIIANK